MRWSLVGLLTLVLVATFGCNRDPVVVPDDGSPADYAAVPDEELFAAIRGLVDVTEADLGHVNRIGEPNTYRAVVLLQPGLDQAVVTDVFDRVVVVLRHGRWGATTIVAVRSGDVGESGATHELSTPEDYDRHYGPQTGQVGWPPPFVGASSAL